MSKENVIAIDGPSGSGKSTLAKLLAKELGVLYIDTGAMFRGLASYCYETNITVEDSDEFDKKMQAIQLKYGVSEEVLIQIDGVDYTSQIREHHVSKLASEISLIPSVRENLLKFQRSLTKERVCVMEGRDIGTVVFPNAFIKFFITASVDIRAERRFGQLQEKGDNEATLEQVKIDVEKRDEKDRNRKVAPLKRAEDAILFDTSGMSTKESVEAVRKIVLNKAQEFRINIQ